LKIRYILLAPAVVLGLCLLATVAVQMRQQILHLREEQELSASAAVREQLLLAAATLAAERTTTYLELSGQQPEVPSARARIATDRAMSASIAALRSGSSQLSEAGQTMDRLQRLEIELLQAREAAQSPGQNVAEASRAWFQAVSSIVDQAQALRLELIRREVRQSVVVRRESRVRFYAGIFSETVAQNQALITAALAQNGAAPSWVFDLSVRNLGRGQLAQDLMGAEGLGLPDRQLQSVLGSLGDDYLAALPELLSDLREETGLRRKEENSERWDDLTSSTLSQVDDIQQYLLASSRSRLEEELAEARQSLGFWALLMFVNLCAVAASYLVIRYRIVVPLELIIGAMLRLARNDNRVALPSLSRQDEFAAMSDALRVFKANALRRERLQQSRDQLHGRLKDAYRSMREDLRAAATIQNTLLPAPGELAGVRFHGLYQPASVVAGDTFNIVRQANGRAGFFQVDVAGHGAPAALGSVVSYHSLSQAMLKEEGHSGLDVIASDVDASWSTDLPYFTMILGEVDADGDRMRLVQAGHPPPLLIRSDGTCEFVGVGGFPIGLVPGASFEVTDVAFRAGDRLLVYSDGVTEAAAPGGEILTQERLFEVVRQNSRLALPAILDAVIVAVRNWQQGDSFEDDVSLLLIERLDAEGGRTHAEPRNS
jgi:serine phosphatase RsbU (regulator of sigma subunit)